MIAQVQAIISEQQQRFVELARVTYQSNDTVEIHRATQQAQQCILQNYPFSFRKLERLITLKQLSTNTRKSIINFYKIAAQQISHFFKKQTIITYECLSFHKRLLYAVQHALDNTKIESELKNPIITAFINLFVLFNPDNHERLISKAKYYFNVKDDLIALGILQMYHQSRASFKHKSEFYQSCLTILWQYFEAKLIKFVGQRQQVEKEGTILLCLDRHLWVLRQICCGLNFERHQSMFVNLLNKIDLAAILKMIQTNRFPRCLMHYMFSIVEHIISSLIRCRLLSEQIKELAKKQLALIIQNTTPRQITSQLEGGANTDQLKFINACFDLTFNPQPLIQTTLTIFDIGKQLIFPNCFAIRSYLHQHAHSFDQLCTFLNDLSFSKESDCYQVVMHRLAITLCQSSKKHQLLIKAVIGTFLFEHLPRISNGKIAQVGSSFIERMEADVMMQAIAFWSNTMLSERDQIVSMLLLTATAPELFVSDMQFLWDLDKFLSVSSDFFCQQGQQITFFMLLLYRNYKDDIFSHTPTSAFKRNLINAALRSHGQDLISRFSLLILKQLFDARPFYESISSLVQHIFQSLLDFSVALDQSLLDLIEIILKHYGQQIAQIQCTRLLLSRVFQLLCQQVLEKQPQHLLHASLTIITTLLDIPAFSQYFDQLIDNITQLAYSIQQRNKAVNQEFISIFAKGLKIVPSLPASAEEVLMHSKCQFDTIQIVNNFTTILKRTSNNAFINWMFEKQLDADFSIQSTLMLHSIAYYQGAHIQMSLIERLIAKIYRYRSLNRLEINYISGKLSILLLLIIRARSTQFYKILQQEKWIDLVESTKQEITKKGNAWKYSHSTDQQGYVYKWPEHLAFVDRILYLIYVEEHLYCWKYDIQTFLIIQISLMLTQLHDPFQFRYANVSFVAVLKNILRAYHYTFNENDLSTDSEDQELYPRRQFDIAFKTHLKVCKQYTVPEEFTQDYIALFRNLFQKFNSNEASKKWMKTILEEVFSYTDRMHLNDLLGLQQCEGNKLRRILKVRRLKNENEMELD